MATGEVVDDESLGGAEMYFTLVSDYLATSEPDAIRLARQIVAHINWEAHSLGLALSSHLL